ncbi:hypothetical protein Vau01_098150 [Virgisporangium aurantiacum]|uniref:Uncharacterized protein n=2 Tax=Virgisporangium aurantiacum TaxID=175570 RepID=A0A8J3ZDQ4_9ACTN|nr:hypothetical protein Vau01_098150 [Virgisporangium aurantiacum]
MIISAPTQPRPDPAAAQDPPTACGISRLAESSDWSMSIATAMDPGGRYIAGRGYPDDPSDETRYPAIWDRGVLTSVPIPGVDQGWRDVNSAGVAVGSSYDPDSGKELTPWVYADGQVRPLRGVTSGETNAINEHGVITGTRSDRVPMRWPSVDSDPQKLPLPAGARGAFARDIDDDGTIVGIYWGADGYEHAVAWPSRGTVEVLPLPTGGSISSALTIRNGWINGWVAGTFGLVAVRWHLPSGAVDAFPQFAGTASYVNAVGWMVGKDQSGAGLFVSANGDLTLPGLGGQPDGHAWRLSDNGHVIAGNATDKEGQLRAVRWDCE